jgi:hypothetical protein
VRGRIEDGERWKRYYPAEHGGFPMTGMRSLIAVALLFLPFPAVAEVCVHDTGVAERFLPVDLFTGTDWNGEKSITFPVVDRTYPWTYSYRDDEETVVFESTTSLKGPVDWTSPLSGKAYKVYDRVVRNARGEVAERMTVIADGTALGRVTDERLARKGGEFQDEGKYPVGTWKQGEQKTFDRTVLFSGKSVASPTSIEIEKLSCVFDGVAGSVQIRWNDPDQKISFSYIFAPGRGMAHVIGGR